MKTFYKAHPFMSWIIIDILLLWLGSWLTLTLIRDMIYWSMK